MKSFFMLIFIAFILGFVSINAQSSISGMVTDKKVNDKLEGVNIFIPELQKGTVTNSEGFYKIEALPTGNFTLQFSRVGYKTKIEKVVIAKKSVEVNVQLEPTNIEMQQVVVVGNSISTLERTPLKVEALSVEALRRSNSESLVGMLSQLPGVAEMSNGVGISRPVIRGMSGYRTVSIINGIKFDNQQFQDEHGFGLDETGIGEVEIIQGPASLIYGAGAMGGVINLMQEKNAPVGSTVGDYNLKIFSNTLGANSSIGLKGTNNNLSWQFHLGGESHADYLNGDNARVPNTRYTGLTANGSVGYNNDWMVSNLDYIYSHHIYGVFELADLTNPKDQSESHFERGFDGPHHIIDFHILSLQNTFFAGESKFKLNLGFQNNHRQEIEAAGESDTSNMGELDLMLNTFSYDAGWITPVISSSTELTIGTQGMFQNNKNEGSRILIPDANTNEFSLYSYLKSSFDKFNIEGGLRYDNNYIEAGNVYGPYTAHPLNYNGQYPNKLTYNTFNGAAGASYSLTNNLVFKLNFSTGFRAPDLAELFSNGIHEGTNRYEIGNVALSTEKNFQTDFGAVFQNSILRIQANYFYNSIKDYIYLQQSLSLMNIYTLFYYRQADALIQGGEVSVDIKALDWLDFNSSYSGLAGTFISGGYLPYMPADKIISKLTFDIPDVGVLSGNYFTITMSNYFDQNKTAANETRTPGYTLFEVSFGSRVHWGLSYFDASLSVTNLTGKDYYDHLSRLKPYGIYNMGRNIVLTFNYPFSI